MIHNHFYYYYVVVFTIPHVIIIQCGVLDVVVLLYPHFCRSFLINVPKVVSILLFDASIKWQFDLPYNVYLTPPPLIDDTEAIYKIFIAMSPYWVSVHLSLID